MPIRLLWADDQREFVEAMTPLLEDLCSAIDWVEDGDVAKAKLEVEAYDAVIVDLQMPPGRWGGLDLVQFLSPALVDLPVLVVSGVGTVAECARAMKLGVRFYVEKEHSTAELRDTVLRMLANAREIQPLNDYQKVREIEEKLQRVVVDEITALAERRGTGFFRIVPPAMAIKTYERMLNEPTEMPQESFLDLLDLRKLLDVFWADVPNFQLLAEVIHPKNREERTKWLEKLNELRRTVAHPGRGVLTIEQRRTLRTIQTQFVTWWDKLGAPRP